MLPRFLIAVLAASLLPARAVPARELTVASRAGPLEQFQREAYVGPFTAATGIPVVEDEWKGGIAALRARNEGGISAWDAVQVDGPELAQGCDEGLLEKLDFAAIGGRDRFLPQGTSDCGAGTVLHGFALAWDRDKFQGTPSWADFWDVAKYPGRRGLRQGARTNLEFALLADGVAPADIYRTLRTDEGVDRAFRKLDQLKPFIVWWQLEPKAAQLLANGEVLMTTLTRVRVAAADGREVQREDRRFGVQWAGALFSTASWAITRASPNRDAALRFLAFTGDPAAGARFAALLPSGEAARATGGAPAPDRPAPPAPNLAGALQIDEAFWRDNAVRLGQRFDAWLAR